VLKDRHDSAEEVDMTPVSELVTNVCKSNEHGIILADWIEAAKLISMDSQSLATTGICKLWSSRHIYFLLRNL